MEYRCKVVADTLAENYILADDSWKYDKMPEFFNGKNVADFIDPDIEAKLEALEREEDALEAQGFYASDDEEIVSLLSRHLSLSQINTCPRVNFANSPA